MFFKPSSAVFLIAYFKLEILKSIAKTLEFLCNVAALIDCWPVPHPAINIYVLLIFKIEGLWSWILISEVKSLIVIGDNLKCEFIHLGYGFSSYCFLTFFDILSVINFELLKFNSIFSSKLGSSICFLMTSCKIDWLMIFEHQL